MTLSPRLKSTLLSVASYVLMAAGTALVTKLATIPELAAYAPYILGAGTFLFGKEKFLPEKSKL